MQFWKKSQNCEIKGRNNLLFFIFFIFMAETGFYNEEQ